MIAATLTDEFRTAIEAAGLTPPDDLIANGKLRRFSSDGRRGDDAGWYVLYDDGIPAGAFGCWRHGFTQYWCSKTQADMTEAEQQAHKARMQQAKTLRDTEEARRRAEVSKRAQETWTRAQPAPTDHPYLADKGVQPHGLRTDGEKLLVPLRDTDGKTWSLQTIGPDGGKRFLPGGRKRGCYFSIGKPDGVLVVCEGFATGASVHEATGHAVAVALDAGNLQAVSQALHDRYRDLRLVLAADDDWKTDGNPGVNKAREAAQAVNGCVALPVFPADRPDRATDFNDLAALAGLDAVRRCIETALREPAPEVAAAPANSGVIVVNGADLKPEPILWLWRDWLALGKLHILAGAPGQGKTTIALAMAATVTVGGHWPDGSRCTDGDVLIWSGEDDPADTLLPRLLAAGADPQRCHFVTGTVVDGQPQPFDPARDMLALQAKAQAIGNVRLLIVDPVVSAVTGDSHKNAEVRRSLQPVVDLAARLGAAAIGITHFSKGGMGGDPATRVIGSVAFTAVARVVMVAAKVKNEEGEERRILARGKSNIGPDDGGFEYHIEQTEPLPDIHASCIAWGQSVAGTARELLNEPAGEDESAGPALSGATDFLLEALKDGPTPTKTLQSEARDAGVAWRTVRRASDALGVVKHKSGFDGGWYWSLPEVVQKNPRCPHENVGHLREKLDNIEDAQGLDKLDTFCKTISGDDADVEVF